MPDESAPPNPPACNCSMPGYCPARNRMVSRIGHRICRSGNAANIAAYFDREARRGQARGRAGSKPAPAPASAPAATPSCAYLGGPVLDPATGAQSTRLCKTCRGNVRLKVFGCGHPGHAKDPTTTIKQCSRCIDHTVELVQAGGDPVLNYWRGGNDTPIRNI